MKKLENSRRAAMGSSEGGYEALQSMLKGEYTEESTGARTIRQTGGKDRHSKVFTARGPRDRRVRLSVSTAIRFYDLQDRLGFEQPSKAVEWLLLHCQPAIQALPQLASLHPMLIATTTPTIPQSAYIDHHHAHEDDKEQESCQDQHSVDHKEVRSLIDYAVMHQNREHSVDHKEVRSFVDYAVMHQNRERSFHHYNYSLQHHLHNSPIPLYTENHVQDSIEEDPPQSSNPSSSGASSDHPISLSSDVAQHYCDVSTLAAEAMPITTNRMASSTGMHQSSTSFPSPAAFHMSKRHRMQHHLQNQHDHAAFASNCANVANMSLRSLAAASNGISSSAHYASLCNTANFNSILISDANAVLINNCMQDQGTEPIMALPSSAYKPSQYADVAQLLLTAQANQLALSDAHHGMQGASNQATMRAAEINGLAYTPNSMNNSIQQYNKIAQLQQVDELVCSSMYASPSPSESTSINTLAAAYSKASGNNLNMGDNQAANILYRSSWNPSSGQL